jgi:hypothetical protein
MLGIILTLLAVFFVICFVFYHSDHPSSQGRKSDFLFYIVPRNPKKKKGTSI